MADEPVVVSKARPVKASNGVEDKTKPTFANTCKGASHRQKHGKLRRGEAYFKTLMSSEYLSLIHKPSEQRDKSNWCTRNSEVWLVRLYKGSNCS